jgi:hypothetical protein
MQREASHARINQVPKRSADAGLSTGGYSPVKHPSFSRHMATAEPNPVLTAPDNF